MTGTGSQTAEQSGAKRAIVLEGVSRWFGTEPGVREVSLTVPIGQSLGVIGPNGSGKTTLLNVMAGHTAPTLGERFYRDENGDRQPLPRECIGYAGHELMIYEQLSPVENLSFFATLYGMEAAGDRIGHLLDTLNLAGRSEDRVNDLSSGMKKKLSLCRALLHAPDVLVLDEPFRGLDRSSREKIEDLLEDFVENRGTILLASHRFREIRRFCRQVLILEDTKPVWCGEPPSGQELETVYQERLQGTTIEKEEGA